MIRLSSGFRNALCESAPIVPLMTGGTIYLYDGTIPDTPDNPPGATLLAQITTDGIAFAPSPDLTAAGLLVQWAHPGAVVKNGNWVMTGVANGTVTWFRWCWRDYDDHLESTYYPRVDGTVGDVLRMSNVVMTTTRVAQIESFILVLPLGG